MNPSVKRPLFAVLLFCFGLVAVLLVLEASMRISSGILEKNSPLPTKISLFDFGNILAQKLMLMRESYPAQHDSVLGWVPKAGYSSDRNIFGKTVTILPNTLRANGNITTLSGTTILATGDSFTFGDSVTDNESWPAILEKTIARPVANGGVFAYGLDQSFLRAKSLADMVTPGVILLGLIPDDVRRMGFSKWSGAEKPYFEIENGVLALKNQPVPDVPMQVDNLGFFKEVFGHFYAVDYFMRKSGRAEWWYEKKYKKISVNNDSNGVARRIVDGLYELSLRKGCRAALVVQYTMFDLADKEKNERKRIYPTILHARERGIPVIDFYPLLNALTPEQLKSYYQGHMTAEGNLFIAKMVAAGMASEGIIPQTSYLANDVAYYRQVVNSNMDELDRLARAKDNFIRSKLVPDSKNPSKYNTLGVVYMKLGDFESAIINFSQALNLDPKYGKALNNLGMVAMLTKRYSDAEKFYQKVISLNPAMHEAYYNMTCLKSLEDDADGAALWLEKAITAGFSDRAKVEKDPDLETARKSKKFLKVLESIPAK